jgi:hypothetical protein
MKPKPIVTVISLLALSAVGCASSRQRELAFWEPHTLFPAVHGKKSRKTEAVASARERRAKPLPLKGQPPYKGLRSGAEVAAYDVGNTVDAEGNLVGTHRVYRVVKSSGWRLRFPWSRRPATEGPKDVYVPPNYRPIPMDQRVKDELAELEKAKRELQEATAAVREKLSEADPLKDKIAQEEDEKQQLRSQLNQALGIKAGTPAAAGPSPALGSPAGAGAAAADANDPLRTWGQ